MLERLLGIQPVAGAISSYSDLPTSAWYYPWVQSSIQLNIAQGTSHHLFKPNRDVTREEAAVLMSRALKQTVKQSLVISSTLPDALFQDQAKIAPWALDSVIRLRNFGLMKGDNGSFRPNEPISRQEAAVLIHRAWTYPGWSERIRATPSEKIQLGWQYGQTTVQFEQQVALSDVNTLSPRWFFLGKTSAVENNADTSLVSWAHKRGKKVWAMVGNHSDQETSHITLSSKDQRKEFIRQLIDLVKQYDIDGLNIDFENMSAQDRDSFTAFVTELHAQLKSISTTLSVNVSPDSGTDWTDVFDYSAIGQAADYVVLMGYDEHWSGDPEVGSVSSLPWLRHGVETLLKKVSPRKVILALPFYTQLWTTSATNTTSSAELDLAGQNNMILLKRLIPDWDENHGQYYAQFNVPNALNQIWLEDGRSLSLKVGLGESYSLAGYGYWYLGGESADIWTSLRNAMRFANYDFS
ncbi:glycosyl hydrolase family 18 protein [Cohnella soli]|uniref:Glycosyl hydrolase family 18 protein n=1 Tax=Cohnella soli TaxID=425005 RepID=A0ABW0HYX8_9BACL